MSKNYKYYGYINQATINRQMIMGTDYMGADSIVELRKKLYKANAKMKWKGKSVKSEPWGVCSKGGYFTFEDGTKKWCILESVGFVEWDRENRVLWWSEDKHYSKSMTKRMIKPDGSLGTLRG